jgi:uncharacterized repeat protein (TIGR03803 family)
MKKLALTLLFVCLLCRAQAQTFTTLYNFTGGQDGNTPSGQVTFDAKGNIYGATIFGGGMTLCGSNSGCGTIYELTPNNGQWTETVLYRFTGGKDGGEPNGGLVFDAQGNLYGTTAIGGSGHGVVFELSPGENGWTETVLKVFWGKNGWDPGAGLVIDPSGNLYGSTQFGGTSTSCISGCGTVFKLSNNAGVWKFQTIYEMTYLAQWPDGPLVMDSKGALYGTTMYGHGKEKLEAEGVAFKVSFLNGRWIHSFIHFFTNTCEMPMGGLSFDAAGNLYGSGYTGNTHVGCVYKMTPNGTAWKFSVLDSFQHPDSGIAIDQSGNLYGTSDGGLGSVFQLTSGSWVYTDLHNFNSESSGPDGNLTLDSSGNVYGTTTGDGEKNFGSVYEIQP